MKRKRRSSGINRTRKRRRTNLSTLVKRELDRRVEKKGVDYNFVEHAGISANFATNDDIFLLNGVQAGAGYFNRIGKLIKPLSLRISGILTHSYTPTAGGDSSGNCVRMAVVLDRTPTATIPAFNEIFRATLEDGTLAAAQLQDKLHLSESKRFKILRDVFIDMPVNAVTGANDDFINVLYPFDTYIKLNIGEVEFSNSTNPMTVANLVNNAIYVVFRAYSASPENDVNLDGEARLRYSDA